MRQKYFQLILFISIIVFGKNIQGAESFILQLKMSHPRNTAFLALSFKQKNVEFVSNFSQTTTENTPSVFLGRFSTPLNSRLQLVKRKIQAYKNLATSKQSISNNVFQILKIPTESSLHNFPDQLLQIVEGKQTIDINESSPYFVSLREVLFEVKDNIKNCVLCAEYKKSGKSIVRIVKKRGRKPASTKFSRKSLKCYRISRQKIECLDPEFGLLEL